MRSLDSVLGPRWRPLNIALAAMLLSLSVLCVQLVLLQAGLVRAQGTLDVCSGCTYESVQEAIDAADPGDTIRVAQGVYTENLVITKSLTLEGGYESSGWARDIELYETTIDGNRTGSVISVTNGCSTTIDGFEIRQGQAERGGGIYIEGSTVSVMSNKLWDNMAGPAFEKLEMNKPLLDGQTVITGVGDPSYDPDVFLYDLTTYDLVGHGEIQADGRFTITVSPPLVEGHTIRLFCMACDHDEAVVQRGDGSLGGLPMGSSNSSAEELGCTGHSLVPVQKVAWLENEGNLEAEGSEEISRADGGSSLWLGGAIYALDSSVVISGNAIISNAAVYFGGGVYAENSTVAITRNEVEANSAGLTPPCSFYYGYGGGASLVGCAEFAVVENTIADNAASRGGAGIYITDSVGSVAGNQISGNDAFEGPCPRGGGIYVGNCSPVIDGNAILSNTAGVVGFPIFPVYGGGVYLLGSSALITDNEIRGNLVHATSPAGNLPEDAQGGGMFAGNSLSSLCSHVPTGSGGVWPVIVGNRIEGNSVESPKWDAKGVGGGLSAYGVSVSLLNNEIVANAAGYNGAGVSVFQHWMPDYGQPGTAVVSGNQVLSSVVEAEPGHGVSGGIVMGYVTATVSNNVIAGNVGGTLAGGLDINGPWALVEGNELVGNRAEAVGGVIAYGGGGEMVFVGNRIVGNVGEGGGGGLGVAYGSFVLAHNEIMSNSGAVVGGVGVDVQEPYTTTVTLEANRIIGNHASETAGGIRIWPDVVFTLTNNIIADNSAEDEGGGIYILDSEGTLINNTITENEEGAGEGIYLDGTAEATILNNIIVSHTYGIYNAGSGTPDVTYNDVWGNSVSDYHGVTPGAGNISSDPWFVDPDNWNYHLWVTSPAVDAGHPDPGLAPSLDIDGEPRPMGSRVDMGADEVPFEVWIWKSDLPDPVLPGGLVTYTIRLSNVSEESYGGLVMADRVPVNTTLHWASDDYEETEGVVSWSVGSLGVGEQVTRTMVVQVDEGLTDGTLLDNGEYGANSEELTRPVMGVPVQTRVGVPLLEITKTAYPDPVRGGGTLTYTLEVKNNGGIEATEVWISDRVPVNTVFSWASDGGEETEGVVTWSIAELGAGETLERTMVVVVAEGLADGTEIENAEYGVECQEVPEGVTGAVVTTTVREPVISIEKSGQPDPVLPGGELTYTIEVSNDGGWEATGVVITDRIPADTSFHWASDGGELMGEAVSWTVGSLEPGKSLERTLVVTVAEGLSDNTVLDNDQYGVRSDEIGPVMGTPITTLVGLPMLTISKEVEPELAFPGGEVEYTLTVSNEGHHVGTGVAITDRVPLETEFAWVLDGGELAGDEVRWTGLSVGPGESVTVHWGATVTDDLLVEEVVNESYGTRCSETIEVVMGEPLSTPLLRQSWWYPLAMKHGL